MRTAVSKAHRTLTEEKHSLTPIPDISGFDFNSGAVMQLNLGQEPVLVGTELLAAALLAREYADMMYE